MLEEPIPSPENEEAFTYRGWRFRCSAVPGPNDHFRPLVELLPSAQRPDAQAGALVNDTEEIFYRTEAEALRHAEQQAVRWVHDRSGTGQGQF